MEHTTKRPLVLSTPPHVFDGITTQKVMLNVVIALVPTLIASFVIFGWRALLVPRWAAEPYAQHIDSPKVFVLFAPGIG